METARAAVAAVVARFAADVARVTNPPDSADAKSAALAAAKAERRVAALTAAEAVLAAPAAKFSAAKKAHAAPLAAVAKDDPTYTPLLKPEPMASTGRRLALAKWITERNEPADRPRGGQPHLDAPLRHAAGPDRRQLRPQRQDADAPGTARLARGRVHSVEVVDEAPAPAHRHVAGVPAQFAERRWAEQDRRPGEPLLLAGEPAAHGGRGRARQPAGRRRATRHDARRARSSTRSSDSTSKRRSLYFRFNTEYKMSFLDQFDAASPTECYERRESVIPQQALALHNSALALNVSREVAKQLAKVADSRAFVTAAFERVLGRAPTERRAEAVRGVPPRAGRALREAGEADAVPARSRRDAAVDRPGPACPRRPGPRAVEPQRLRDVR